MFNFSTGKLKIQTFSNFCNFKTLLLRLFFWLLSTQKIQNHLYFVQNGYKFCSTPKNLFTMMLYVDLHLSLIQRNLFISYIQMKLINKFPCTNVSEFHIPLIMRRFLWSAPWINWPTWRNFSIESLDCLICWAQQKFFFLPKFCLQKTLQKAIKEMLKFLLHSLESEKEKNLNFDCWQKEIKSWGNEKTFIEIIQLASSHLTKKTVLNVSIPSCTLKKLH